MYNKFIFLELNYCTAKVKIKINSKVPIKNCINAYVLYIT